MRNDDLCSFVSQLEKLPGDPIVYDAIRRELTTSKPDLSVLAGLVSSDIGLTLKMLQLSDAGFFGARPVVFDPAKAVNVLGIDLLTRLALETPTFEEHELSNSLTPELRFIQRHSVAVASVAREIAALECEDMQFVDACYAAGLLHDIGKLVLCAYAPEQYTETFRRSISNQLELEDEERRLFGASHSEIGAYLLALWGLPEPIVEAVALHHEPARQNPCQFGVTSILHVANSLQHCSETAEWQLPNAEMSRSLDFSYVQEVRRSEQLQQWIGAFQGTIAQHDRCK